LIVPSEAIDSFAGVGYYFDMANLKEGEYVLDLGSGSGMDSFIAALKVGKKGKVFGVDMTDEQLEKARHLSNEYKFENISFHKSYIERLPFSDNTIDVVISNGLSIFALIKKKYLLKSLVCLNRVGEW